MWSQLKQIFGNSEVGSHCSFSQSALYILRRCLCPVATGLSRSRVCGASLHLSSLLPAFSFFSVVLPDTHTNQQLIWQSRALKYCMKTLSSASIHGGACWEEGELDQLHLPQWTTSHLGGLTKFLMPSGKGSRSKICTMGFCKSFCH